MVKGGNYEDAKSIGNINGTVGWHESNDSDEIE